MYRSLLDLRQNVDRLIEMQGEDAPCAAFIFTKSDVSEDSEEEFIDNVLSDIGDNDAIYEYINDCLGDAMRDEMQRRSRN